MRKKLAETIEKAQNNEVEKNDLLTEITFFQHERLVHLLVTIFTGITTILFLLGALYFEAISLIILFLISFILFIPYIMHYFFLENGVQKLYDLYNNLKK